MKLFQRKKKQVIIEKKMIADIILSLLLVNDIVYIRGDVFKPFNDKEKKYLESKCPPKIMKKIVDTINYISHYPELDLIRIFSINCSNTTAFKYLIEIRDFFEKILNENEQLK